MDLRTALEPRVGGELERIIYEIIFEIWDRWDRNIETKPPYLGDLISSLCTNNHVSLQLLTRHCKKLSHMIIVIISIIIYGS